MEHQHNNRELHSQNFASDTELYASITKEGSLGLLALGSRGLFLWRKKRVDLGEVFPPVAENLITPDTPINAPENDID